MAHTRYDNNLMVKILPATFTSTSGVSWVDVTGFSLPVMANTSYEFEFEIIFQTSATNRGIGFGLNGPASPTSMVIYSQYPVSLTTVQYRMARAYNTIVSASNDVDLANTNMYGRCYGNFVNGANAGDLILSILGERSHSSPSYSIMANSVMKLWRTSPIN